MSVEQTDQLIQLILNSVVMVAACTFLLGGLLRRHHSVGDRLQQIQHQYLEVMSSYEESRNRQVTYLKKQLCRLRHRHRFTHYSILAVHYALLFLTGSTFLMALRTVFETNLLIRVALALFVVGIAVLLLAIGLTLHDLQFSDRCFWRDLRLSPPRSESKPIASHSIASKLTEPKLALQQALPPKSAQVQPVEERSPDTRVG